MLTSPVHGGKGIYIQLCSSGAGMLYKRGEFCTSREFRSVALLVIVGSVLNLCSISVAMT